MFITNLIMGAIVIALGVAGIKYNGPITHAFGTNNWIDQKLGSGSSFGLFMMLAFLMIIWGFLIMFGLSDEVIGFLTSPLRAVFAR